MDVCAAADVPVPELRYEHTGLWVTFHFSLMETPGETTQETTQARILVLLKRSSSITRKALAESVGITPDGVKYHLEKLKAAEVIRHVGPTKAGYWEVLK